MIYVIYSALCRICPTLHELQEVGIHPIAGIPTHNNFLELTPNSCLKIRIHHLQLPLIYPYLIRQKMSLNQEITVKNIDHLGIVAGLIDEIKIVKIINDIVNNMEGIPL